MNLFANILEQAFDEQFRKNNKNITENNPIYLEKYRLEVESFANFLITLYEQDKKELEYWTKREQKRKQENE